MIISARPRSLKLKLYFAQIIDKEHPRKNSILQYILRNINFFEVYIYFITIQTERERDTSVFLSVCGYHLFWRAPKIDLELIERLRE